MGALIAAENTPKVNLIAAKRIRELVAPAVNEELAKPRMPIPSIHFLFHLLERSLINMFEHAYATLNMSEAMIP